MRPIRLDMTAFGPFGGTEVVDFRVLGDSCFFLIHGPTGAGKTSVLDGMCFALYGLGTGSERTPNFMRSDFAADDVPTQVVFDFRIGDDSYRISRRPKQERANANGTTSTILPLATLWRRTGAPDDAARGDVLADGVRDVGEKIESLLGFSVDQFRQVVMLPQGEFRKLLSADSRARQGILEELFNASLYRELEDFLRSKKRAAEQELMAVHQRLAGVFVQLGVTDQEELSCWVQEARGDLTGARALAEAAREEADEATRRLEAGKRLTDLFDACSIADGHLSDCVGALDDAEKAFDVAAAEWTEEHARDAERLSTKALVGCLEKIAEKAEALADAAEQLETAKACVATANEQLVGATDVESTRHTAAGLCCDKYEEALAAQGRLPQLEAKLNETTGLLSNLMSLGRWERRKQIRAEKAKRLGAMVDAVTEQRRAALRDLRVSEEHWRAGQAGILAQSLIVGEPCPVCGSPDHPAPAVLAEDVPTEEAVAAAQARLDDLDCLIAAETDKHQRARQRLAASEATAGTIRSQLGERVGVDHAELESQIGDLQQKIEPLRDLAETIPTLERESSDAQSKLVDASQAIEIRRQSLRDAELLESRVKGFYEERLQEVPEQYRDGEVLARAIENTEKRQLELQEALEKADEAKRTASDELIRTRADERAARKVAEDAARSVEGQQKLDIDALQAEADRTAGERNKSMMAFGQAKTLHKSLRQGVRVVARLHAESETKEQRYGSVALLADVACGANASNISFQRYVLALFLDEVLATATHRLLAMTDGRYQLHAARAQIDRRRAGGLDLEIFDEFTGEDRPVGTLSGGEGFLASLALALALAEVVQRLSGGIRLDAVFIDEGFGTLSPEALDAAIDTLLTLREHDRLVGVISHVPELRERIDCRLEVIPSKTGSTTRFAVP